MSKTVLFQEIQFSISMQFSSIWLIDRLLSGATTPSQSGPGSDSNERVKGGSLCYLFTFDWPCKLVDLKNNVHLHLKVNNRQQKCYMNYVGVMPEGKLWGHLKNILWRKFSSLRESQQSRQWAVTQNVMPFWVLVWGGQKATSWEAVLN